MSCKLVVFLTPTLMLLEAKIHDIEQDYALKYTFFFVHLTIQITQILKKQFLSEVKCHMGGVRKVPKNITYYLHCPLHNTTIP